MSRGVAGKEELLVPATIIERSVLTLRGSARSWAAIWPHFTTWNPAPSPRL